MDYYEKYPTFIQQKEELQTNNYAASSLNYRQTTKANVTKSMDFEEEKGKEKIDQKVYLLQARQPLNFSD